MGRVVRILQSLISSQGEGGKVNFVVTPSKSFNSPPPPPPPLPNQVTNNDQPLLLFQHHVLCCAVHVQTLYVMYCLRSNRRISYCCSVLGSTQTPIDLPLTSPFYLIAYGSKVCQLVRGAQSSLEYIFYETEYSTFMTKNDYGGAHPYGVTRDPQGQMIFYCYYRRELQFIF